MSHEIYIYTTKSQSKRSIAEIDGEKFYVKLKLGETMVGSADRIQQQDGTSNSEKLDQIYNKFIPDHITDKVWHRAMEKEGYVKARDDKEREWFVFPDCLTAEEAKNVSVEILMDLVHGRRAVEDFEPDDYQIEFAKWSKTRWDSGSKRLLNGSKMRSGKCMMGHLTTLANDFKKVLIISGKPGALRGWGELLIGGEKSHIKFFDNHFFHYKDQKNRHVKFTNQRNTVAVGLQWIHTHTKRGANPLLSQLLTTEWDAVYIDESHSFRDTKLALDFISKLKIKNGRVLDLTGTPFKTLMTGEIPQDDRWAWDYIQEQKHRKWLLENNPNSDQAKRFKYLPKVNYAMMRVPEAVKKHLNGALFNLGANGLWAIDKETKHFVYPEAVNEMINFIRTQGYKNVPDVFKSCIDLHTRHSFWLLPDNVEAIKRLRDLLERHPYFKKFKIIVASGNETKDDDIVKDIIDRIEQGLSDYKGTITISCGRLVEGTTVPEWCSVHQINSDKSVTSYFQSGFRAGSPWKEGDKQEVGIYDYDPERFLEMLYTLAIDSCDRENSQSPSEWIETEWNDVSDVYDFDNEWNVLSGKDVVKKATEEISGNSNLFSDLSLVDRSKIDNKMIAEMLGADFSNSQSGSTTMNSNGLETGSVSSNRGPDSNNIPAEKTKEEILITQLQISEAIKKIPNLIFVSYDYAFKITSIFDIVKCHEIGVVKEQTGLTSSQWGVIINTINVDKLNRRIDAYVNS